MYHKSLDEVVSYVKRHVFVGVQNYTRKLVISQEQYGSTIGIMATIRKISVFLFLCLPNNPNAWGKPQRMLCVDLCKFHRVVEMQ